MIKRIFKAAAILVTVNLTINSVFVGKVYGNEYMLLSEPEDLMVCDMDSEALTPDSADEIYLEDNLSLDEENEELSLREIDLDEQDIVRESGEILSVNETYLAYDDKASEEITTEVNAYIPSGDMQIDIPYHADGDEFALNAVDLPPAYDSRTKGFVSSVKNQGYYGTCWAHANICAVESSLMSDNLSVGESDLSEYQMAYFFNCYKNVNDPHMNTGGDYFEPSSYSLSGKYNLGGNNYAAAIMLMDWIGPTEEYKAPYSRLVNNLDEGYAFDDYAHIENAYFLSSGDRNGIKQGVMEYGALSCSYASYSDYYNGAAYFSGTGRLRSNHAVSIVGWDDNYPASNFGMRPPGNGAWLIKNSYGPESYDGGYMWISYYEGSLGDIIGYDCALSDNYDNNYFYDGCTRWDVTKSFAAGVSVANVFEADDAEILKAVSLAVADTNISYSLQIYLNPDNPDDPTSGIPMLAKEQTGSFAYEGFFTIPLDEQISIDKNDKYSVVFTLNRLNSNKVTLYSEESRDSFGWGSWVAESFEGVSFYKEAGSTEFVDYGTLEGKDEYSGNMPGCFRIHAYTDNDTEWRIDKTAFDGNTMRIERGTASTLEIISSEPIEQNLVSMTSNNSSVLEIVSGNVLQAKNLGVATVTVNYKGKTRYVRVFVYKTSDDLTISLDGYSFGYTGKNICPGVYVYDGGKLLSNNDDYYVSYHDNKNIGTGYVLIKFAGSYSGERRIDFEIHDVFPITLAKFSEPEDTFLTYDKYGNVIPARPSVECIEGYEDYELREGKNSGYTLEYFDNDTFGTGKVEIIGNGYFYGSIVYSFKINKRNLSTLEDMQCVFTDYDSNGNHEVVYNGYKHTPKLTISYLENPGDTNSRAVLTQGVDFKVSTNTKKTVGKAKVTVTGMGNFTGKKTVYYDIQKKNIEDTFSKKMFEKDGIVEVSIPDCKYNGKAQKPTVKVVLRRVDGTNYTMKKNKDYTVSYENNINLGTVNDSIAPRAIITGKGNFCGVLRIPFNIIDSKIVKKNIATLKEEGALKVQLKNSCECYYSGYAVKPFDGFDGIVLQYVDSLHNLKLIRNTDYMVKYSKNTKVGAAYATIIGKGNFKGSFKINFNINPLNMDCVVALVSPYGGILDKLDYSKTYEYTGKVIKPEVNVYYLPNHEYDKKILLKKNSVYTISYGTNKLPGTGTLTVTRKGKNFEGDKKTVDFRFDIGEKSITDAVVDKVDDVKYTGGYVYPKVNVKLGKTVLREGIDYTLSYSNNDYFGKGTITINGCGLYKGKKTVYFVIK